MRTLFRCALVGVIFSIGTPALAQECDQAEAAQLIEDAIKNDLISGYTMFDSAPAIVVSERIWRDYPDALQVGLIDAFECAVAGPGNVLHTMKVITGSGRLLDEYDGLRRRWR